MSKPIKNSYGREFSSLADAIEDHITEDPFTHGVAELAVETGNKAGRAIGVLVQLLFEKGIISEDETKMFYD